MNEKNFPNWMLVAVVCGFGELSYWSYGRWGIGWMTKLAIGLTILAGVVAVLIYVNRTIKRLTARQNSMKREL